jgi:hypothetical protein
MGSTAHILEGAKKALDNANKFTGSVTEGKPSAFAPKSSPTDYPHARTARVAAGHEFMGVKSDQAPELNTALESRATAKKALEQ